MNIKTNITTIPDDITLYTVTEVANIMKTSRGYVYQLLNAGLLPYIQLGNKKIRHDALAEFLKKAEGYNYTDPYNIVRAS